MGKIILSFLKDLLLEMIVSFVLIVAVAFIVLFLGLSYGIKWLCRKYTKRQNCNRTKESNE